MRLPSIFRFTKLFAMNQLESFIDNFGTTRLAEELGVSVSLVSSWRHGRFPVSPRHCRKIEALSQGAVTASQLQPEVFGEPRAETNAA
jgi:DNA-binding transcriptional regulator YdaS (Cro superfamily)